MAEEREKVGKKLPWRNEEIWKLKINLLFSSTTTTAAAADSSSTTVSARDRRGGVLPTMGSGDKPSLPPLFPVKIDGLKRKVLEYLSLR